MSVTCLISVENESRNQNQIFGVNIEIPGVSGYKRDFSVWTLSKVLVIKHSTIPFFFLSLGLFPFFFWLWSAFLQVRLFGHLSELHYSITMKIFKNLQNRTDNTGKDKRPWWF